MDTSGADTPGADTSAGIAAAGWYHAEGDPPGTSRYWDGEIWQGEPVTPDPFPAPPRPAPPQSAPTHGGGDAGPIETLSPLGYLKRCFTSGYADFGSRARRAEYGWFVLLTAIVQVVVSIPLVISLAASPDEVELGGLAFVTFALVALFFLASIVPSLAVSVRRLHDLGLSGWFLLLFAILSFVPLLGFLSGLYLLLADSKRERNKWGPSPKYG